MLHGVASWLTLLTARRMQPMIAAFLFALHPVHVETVAWSSASNDQLMTIFALAAFLFHTKAEDEAAYKWKWSIMSWICFRSLHDEQRTGHHVSLA